MPTSAKVRKWKRTFWMFMQFCFKNAVKTQKTKS